MFTKDTISGSVAASDLTAHVGEIGSTWTKHASQPTGSLLISSSGDVYANNTVDNIHYTSGVPASADYSVFADVKMRSDPGPAHASVCGRVNTAALTYYRFAITKTGIFIQKVVAGAITTLTSDAYVPIQGTTYRIGLHMSGTSIKATINGYVVLSTTDASIADAGRMGIDPYGSFGNDTGWHTDNVVGANSIFWVGGNGTIASSSHWSRLPAGSSGITPASTDDAYIDQNSGSPTVTVDVNQTLSSLTIGTANQFTDTTKTMTLTGSGSASLTLGGDLNIYGDAAFGSALSNITVSGLCVWRQFSSSYIPQLTLAFAASMSCDHTPLGEVQCNVTTFIHTSGTLTLPLLVVNDKYASLNVGTYDTTVNSNARTLVLGNSVMGSEMKVLTKLDLRGTGMTYTNLNRLVVYFTGEATTANLNSLTLGSIHVDAGRCVMTGANVANSLILERGTGISMASSCTFGYIAIASDMSIVIGAGTTLTGNPIIQNYNELARNVSVSSSVAGTKATWNMNNSGALTKSRWRVQDIAFTNGSVLAYHSQDLGNNTGIRFMAALVRSYRYAVYDFAGTYIGEYTDVVSDPSFERPINSPPGQMVIRRKVDPMAFGEGTLVDYDNKVVVSVTNDDYPNGKVIYQGAIESWLPNIEAGNGYVDITLIPYGAELSQFPVIDESANDVQYFQSPPRTLLSFTSDKLAVSWTTGVGVILLGQVITTSILYANTPLITVSIYKDNGSNTPDNTVPVYTIDYDVEDTATPQIIYSANPGSLSVTASSKYWLVVDTHGGNVDASRVFTTNDYASGNAAYWNGSAWVQSASYGAEQFWTTTTNSDTAVSFSADDLKTSLISLLTTYASLGGRVRYSDFSIEDPEVTFTYDFNSNTMLDAAQKFVDQCPAGWYWYVDPATNLFHLHPQPAVPAHRFTLGTGEIEKVQLQRTKASVVNSLYVTGGDTGGGSNLFRNYVNNVSISRYRRRTKFYNDINLTSTAAANAIGEKIIGQAKDAIRRGSATILGAPDVGADLEALNPGDLFVILNMDGTPIYLQLASVLYAAVRAEIDASNAPMQINNALNDTQVALRQQQNVNNPATATVVEVL